MDKVSQKTMEEDKSNSKPQIKRQNIDKQSAYIEFKESEGKKIEESIIHQREQMKIRR